MACMAMFTSARFCAIGKAVDALLGDARSRAVRERLAALEAERDQIEAAIVDVAPPTVEYHPNAANAYRDKVRDLKRSLAEADDDSHGAANEAIRQIVERSWFTRRGDTSRSSSRFMARSLPRRATPNERR